MKKNLPLLAVILAGSFMTYHVFSNANAAQNSPPPAATKAAAADSSCFYMADNDEERSFCVQKTDGALKFGISIWAPGGLHCGIVDVTAPSETNKWRHESGYNSADPNEPCQVNIERTADSWIVKVDPQKRCQWACGGSPGALTLDSEWPDKVKVGAMPDGLLDNPQTFMNWSPFSTPQRKP